jgi:hypothetical protein
MRTVSWVLGLVLGSFASGAALIVGVLGVVPLVFAGAWAAREPARPAGLGGLVVGLGAGAAGLLLLANARCAASNVSGPGFVSECVAPDLTPYLAGSAALIVAGVAVSIAAASRDAQARAREAGPPDRRPPA